MDFPWHMQTGALENARQATERLAAQRVAKQSAMQDVVLSVQQLPSEDLLAAIQVVEMIAAVQVNDPPIT